MLPGITPDQYKKLLLSVGSHRGARPLSPIEVAQAIRSTKRAGATSDEIASAMHLEGATMIRRFLRLLDLPEDVQLIVDWGRTGATIAFTGAAELARLPSKNEQSIAGRAALEYQFSTSELKSLVQLRLRSGRPISECIKEVVGLRPQITVRHVFIGAVKGEKLKELLRELPQVDRDRLILNSAAQLWPDAREAAFRLGADRFTISLNDDIAGAVFEDIETLEQRLSDQLASKADEMRVSNV